MNGLRPATCTTNELVVVQVCLSLLLDTSHQYLTWIYLSLNSLLWNAISYWDLIKVRQWKMCMSDCVGCFTEGIQQGGVIVLGGILDISADNSSSARHACLTLSNLKHTSCLTTLNISLWREYELKHIWRGCAQLNQKNDFQSNISQDIELSLRYFHMSQAGKSIWLVG